MHKNEVKKRTVSFREQGNEEGKGVTGDVMEEINQLKTR